MDGFGALRPSLERQEGRPAERKQRLARRVRAPAPRSAAGSSGRAGRRARRSPRATRRTRSQPSRPTMPASTIVRMSASSPTRSLSSSEQRAARNEAGSPDGGEHGLNLGAFHADRPARRRQGVFGFTRMSALLVYIRTILRQTSAWRKNSMRADESKSGATAEALIGRSLQRSQRRRVSRQRPHPRPLASRPSARRAAFGADLPRDRTRRGQTTA